MELRPSLDQYDEQSFLGLVEALWQVDTNQVSHNAWVAHFNHIVGHPAGSDLLFYSDAEKTGNINSPEYIVETIKFWHQQNGRVAFKDQTLPPPSVHQSLTREQRALESSNRNLKKARKVAADVIAAEHQAALQLGALEQQLTMDPTGSSPYQQLANSLSTLRTLEITQHRAKFAVSQLERQRMSVRFALDGAVRDANSPFLNTAIQSVVLQEITAASQRHAAALAAAQARHPRLYAQGVVLIERLEARIAQLASATASGPGHEPLTFRAAAETASLSPVLLTAQGLGREVAEQQHHLIKTIRSAVAELEWQATSVQGDHPGTYADVVEFVLGTPSDDPRFAFTIPLVELLDGEQHDWASLAEARAEVHVPMRLCSTVKGAAGLTSTGVKPFTRYCHVLMTSTNGSVPASVRVRSAAWDADRQALSFKTDGISPVTVKWLKGNAPYAPEDQSLPPSIGFLRMPPVPLTERFEDLLQVQFDDYIVVFPEDTGLEPLYIMFRDRREL